MSLLSRDRFARGAFSAQTGAPFSLRLPLLFFCSFSLIALSRLDHPVIRDVRVEAQAFVAPALSAAIVPFDSARRLVRQVQSSYDGFAELEKLRGENQRLKQWESRAGALERKLGEMAHMSKAVEEEGIEYRTVRVIATSSGAFVNSALLGAGTEHGIQHGQPVMGAGGILGRIVEAGRRTSRLLLLTDVNSRVPVAIGPTQVRAILAGDNTAEPRLLMLPQGAALESGDEIVTTGVGGMFPRGLRVGTVSASSRVPRAHLGAGLGQTEYVSVLLFENPGTALARELRPAKSEAAQRPRQNLEQEDRR